MSFVQLVEENYSYSSEPMGDAGLPYSQGAVQRT